MALDAVFRALRRMGLLGLGVEGAGLRMLAHSTFLAQADANLGDGHDSIVDVHFSTRCCVMLLTHQVLQ